MAKCNVVDIKGKKKSTMTVSDIVLDAKINQALIAQAIRVHSINQRQGTKRTKTRSEISYTGGKMWRQKGTGRARHSSRRAPIFVGGGRAHGPTGNENYRRKLTKKMRRQVLAQVLTLKHQEKTLTVVDTFKAIKPKTKDALKALSDLSKYPETKKVLVVLEDTDQNLINAVKNLKGVTTTQAKRINSYELIWHKHVLVSKEAMQQMAAIISGEEIKAKASVASSNKKTSPKKK